MSSEPIRVVVAMDFSDKIMDELRAVSPRLHIERHFPDVPERAWTDAEILYTGTRFPTPAQAPHLRWIQLHSAGYDHAIHQPILQAPDVLVTSTSGIHATPMAEYCFALMLAFAYKVPRMLQLQSKTEWPQKRQEIFTPHELRGSTLGIVGYGSVGRELARLAVSFGMTVLATKRDLLGKLTDEGYIEPGTGDPDGSLPERLYPPEALASMAHVCDYLVVTVPLTPDTHHLVNAAVFDAMKPTAVVINVARGSVIDEAALIDALQAKKIGGAGLDVFEEEPLPPSSPLWGLSNVIISPHVAGASTPYHTRAAAVFIENLNRYLEGRPLLNLLDKDKGY